MLYDLFDVLSIPDEGASEELPHDMRAASEDHSDRAAQFRNEIHILLRQIRELQEELWSLKDERGAALDD
jgi:hypothetical protein